MALQIMYDPVTREQVPPHIAFLDSHQAPCLSTVQEHCQDESFMTTFLAQVPPLKQLIAPVCVTTWDLPSNCNVYVIHDASLAESARLVTHDVCCAYHKCRSHTYHARPNLASTQPV